MWHVMCVLVLISVLLKRVSVSRMRNFFLLFGFSFLSFGIVTSSNRKNM
jgi:hypothetical protein